MVHCGFRQPGFPHPQKFRHLYQAHWMGSEGGIHQRRPFKQRCVVVMARWKFRPTSGVFAVGPLPRIEGFTLPKPATRTPASPTVGTLSQPIPPLSQEDRTKFRTLFVKCEPYNGLLGGEITQCNTNCFLTSRCRRRKGKGHLPQVKSSTGKIKLNLVQSKRPLDYRLTG